MRIEVKDYIEREILPCYESFDKAHGISHVMQVIEQSLALAPYYDVDREMVYTIAAYHDTGLCQGRERHHIVSGEILVKDKQLQEFFTAEQIQIMREAVEDHRASSDHEPRSIYGRIVAEADRCISPQTIIRRTIQYGLTHYAELSREGHFARCVAHLNEKYGRQGYLKLWIPESNNAKELERLRTIIENATLLRQIFEQIFDQESGSE